MESIDTQIFLAYIEFKAWCKRMNHRTDSFTEFRKYALSNLEVIHIWLK